MILANYCNLFATNSSDYTIKDITGANATVYRYSNESGSLGRFWTMMGAEYDYYAYYARRNWVDVGFGDTAENAGDYSLASPNYGSGQLTHSGGGINTHNASDTNRVLASVYEIVTNNTLNPITVKEVGLFGTPGSGSGVPKCLLCRKVLDTPVVIEPGDSYTFTYRIRIKDT